MASHSVPTPVCDWAIYLWIPAADIRSTYSLQYTGHDKFPTPVCDWAIFVWIPAADVWKLGLATPTRTHSLCCEPSR
ncbi:16459_t:CDS:2 [Racocetra persica]|uniref:16459_t:CDS:1 n=1 Tax=Racocetra persica TaxID=160502 RepID=A0ACA9MIW8_9GLOM|nr:16459_t:CDS:2 [Racocetra persica]